MKQIKPKYMISLILSWLLCFVSLDSPGQCNVDPLINQCSSKLGDFIFLKSYKIDGVANAGEIEYSYVLSKETTYFLALSDGKDDIPQITVTLLDGNRKPIASNFDKKTAKYFPGLAYKCGATGVFYMVYRVNSPSSKCAVSVIGFKKK